MKHLKKLTSEQRRKFLTQAVEIADSYLDFELDGDEAQKQTGYTRPEI